MDFERSIFENRAALGRPFLAAYKIALDQGAAASCRCCKINDVPQPQIRL